jgi:hypothetical protein
MKLRTCKYHNGKHEWVLVHKGAAEYKKGDRDVHKFYGSYERCKKCGKVRKHYDYIGPGELC